MPTILVMEPSLQIHRLPLGGWVSELVGSERLTRETRGKSRKVRTFRTTAISGIQPRSSDTSAPTV
jgi:hypothetical protein